MLNNVHIKPVSRQNHLVLISKDNLTWSDHIRRVWRYQRV